jgi:hypothetical protein
VTAVGARTICLHADDKNTRRNWTELVPKLHLTDKDHWDTS